MTLQASSQAQLRQFVEQIEALEDEKKDLATAISEKYSEAKGVGFDIKAIRKIVAMRRKSAAERDEEQSILETYLQALGMLAGTPLGDAALRTAIREAAE
jgi:uncharacterized protein (UPF0335 family)